MVDKLLKRLCTVSLIGALALLVGPVEKIEATPTETGTGVEAVADADITFAIERELLLAHGVDVDPIDVETSLGVVTLAGSVRNLLAKERAERIASSVKGVRAVVNRIQVLPPVRSDVDIMTDVKAALARDPATDSWEIGVVVVRGQVTLSGEVDSWVERRLAEKVVRGIKGVAAIENQIEVVYKMKRPDSEIRHDIESALAWDVRVDDGLIDVEVKNREVRLTGTVGSAYERNQAVSLSYVAGVETVDASELEVEWWARDEMLRREILVSSDDERVEAAVRDALLVDPRVTSFRPEVEVDNGVVTLSGSVGTVKAKRAAAQDAANTTGVWRVKNYLKVRPAVERTDHEIAEEIRSALLADPYVERFEIDVLVYDGVASLTGTVDSRFEKRHAEDLASRTVGVTSIRNLLLVSYEPVEGQVAFYDWDVVDSDYVFEPLTLTRRSDWEIRQDIEDEMFWSPWVDADEVEVSVDDGIATLTGTVDSWTERVQAEEEAIEGGATLVENDLEVRWGPDLPIF